MSGQQSKVFTKRTLPKNFSVFVKSQERAAHSEYVDIPGLRIAHRERPSPRDAVVRR